MVQVHADVIAQARGNATAAVEAAAADLAAARTDRSQARAAAAAAIVQARASRVPWARLRELTGATRQVLTTRVDRALGDQQPATNPAMPAELAGGRVTAAWQQDADARTAVTTATGRLADAIIVARETRVPWRAITAATGTSREAVIAMVRRTQADQAGDTQPIWEGTSPPPADREPAGPWRWPSVRDAVAAAPARVGDQLRRRMLADGAPPARILAAVSDARTAAHTAAVGAVDTGEPDDPEQLVTAVWKAAAAHSIDASL